MEDAANSTSALRRCGRSLVKIGHALKVSRMRVERVGVGKSAGKTRSSNGVRGFSWG